MLTVRSLPVLLCATGALSFATPAPAVGPPTLCEPIEIGDAPSLPWGGEAWNERGQLALDVVAERTVAVLDASPSALVHMETLRRATIYVSGMGKKGAARSPEEAQALLRLLHERIVRAEHEEAPGDVLGLAWFDLGYALSAYEQAGLERGKGNRDALARAAELRPDDGAVHLGCALGSWTRAGKRAERRLHFRRAAELATDPESLLRVNLMRCAEHFLAVKTYDELVASLRS